jgi:hypothetical protein
LEVFTADRVGEFTVNCGVEDFFPSFLWRLRYLTGFSIYLAKTIDESQY